MRIDSFDKKGKLLGTFKDVSEFTVERDSPLTYKITEDWYAIHITLEDQEEMFFDGKPRTYETPHGVLQVIPVEGA